MLMIGSGVARAAVTTPISFEQTPNCLTNSELRFFSLVDRHFVPDPLERLPLDFLIPSAPPFLCTEACYEENQCDSLSGMVHEEPQYFASERRLFHNMNMLKKKLLQLSSSGNFLATLALGHIYMHGVVIPQDLSVADKYISKVADKYVPAMFQKALFLFKHAHNNVEQIRLAHQSLQNAFQYQYLYAHLFLARNALQNPTEMEAKRADAFSFLDTVVKKTGNHDALFLRGRCHQFGIATQKNESLAKNDYLAAMVMKNDEAAYFYAMFLYDGVAGEKNVSSALKIWNGLTYPGHSKNVRVAALNQLASHFIKIEDRHAASLWVNEAVALGSYFSALAYFKLAHSTSYKNGGIVEDFWDDAFKVLKIAAQANFPPALTYMGILSQYGIFAPINESLASDYYQRAILGGDVEAKFRYASISLNLPAMTSNSTLGKKYLQEAANEGFPLAQVYYAAYLMNANQKLFPVDIAKAEEILLSHQYLPQSLFYLGLLRWGQKKYQDAKDFFIRSCHMGDAAAGTIFYAGTDEVERDVDLALRCLEAAAKAGNEDAAMQLRKLKK